MTKLEHSMGFLLVRAARGMKRALDNELSDIGITASQHAVLSALAYKDGLSLTQIARRVFLDNPATTGLVDRLERDGLVERHRVSSDRRVINIYLTTKGKSILNTIDGIATNLDMDVMSVLSHTERKTLRSMLNRIWDRANGQKESV
ncbi:MAG: MarR family transcriptional regulator [Candidatus Neomarinimicrobiota bacterium]